MADRLLDLLRGLDIEANVNLDEDRTHITDELVAFVEAADAICDPDEPTFPYDAARARLLAAITGEKE